MYIAPINHNRSLPQYYKFIHLFISFPIHLQPIHPSRDTLLPRCEMLTSPWKVLYIISELSSSSTHTTENHSFLQHLLAFHFLESHIVGIKEHIFFTVKFLSLQHNVLEIHQSCGMYQQIVPFDPELYFIVFIDSSVDGHLILYF